MALPLNAAHGSLSLIRILTPTKLAEGRLALTELLTRILYNRYQFVHVQWRIRWSKVTFSWAIQCWCPYSEGSGQHGEAGAPRELLWEFRTEPILLTWLTWCFYIHRSRIVSSRTRACSTLRPGTSSQGETEEGVYKVCFLGPTFPMRLLLRHLPFYGPLFPTKFNNISARYCFSLPSASLCECACCCPDLLEFHLL